MHDAKPDPTPEPLALHEHRGTRAVQRMVEHAPSSGGLALWARHQDVPDDAAHDRGPTRVDTRVDTRADTRADPRADVRLDTRVNTRATTPAWTDGRTVFYRPAFEQLPLAEQAGWVAHQVLHIALRHAQRFLALRDRLGDADLQLFNTCADAIVNSTLDHLAWLQLPAAAVRLPQLLRIAVGETATPEAALLSWDVERLYRAVDDRRPASESGRASNRAVPQRQGQGQGEGKGQGQSSSQSESQSKGDDDGNRDENRNGHGREDGPRAAAVRALGTGLASDLVPSDATRGAPQDEAEDTRAWGERILRGHASDGEHSMLRALLADLPRSRTPWELVLRTRLARALAQRPAPSWSRPSRSYLANQGRTAAHRRMPWEPGTTASEAVPRLALVVDVSGSIDAALLERFAREVDALSRRLEAGLVLVVGDDRVRRVEHFAPGRSGLIGSGGLTSEGGVFEGGGDTDFTPLLEEAQRHAPDIVVVLTDLLGPARFRPRCPVIWAVPDSVPGAVAPFGQLLELH